MIEKIQFVVAKDVPLGIALLLGFLLYFEYWARRAELEPNVDLVGRLPKARLLVIGFFAVLITGCWLCNISLWVLLVLMFVFGAIISLIIEGSGDLGFGMLLFSGYLIREWAFGFPHLRLQPPNDSSRDEERLTKQRELVGATGKTVTVLRPYGDAEVDGTVQPVISGDGSFVEAETEIVVSGMRNGVLSVEVIESD